MISHALQQIAYQLKHSERKNHLNESSTRVLKYLGRFRGQVQKCQRHGLLSDLDCADCLSGFDELVT